MNGQRIVRKYFERITDEELYGMNEAAKKDDSQEAMCIRYLAECELVYRMEKKRKEIQKALDQLGVDGYLRTKWITWDRIAVYIYNDYFGIWDTTRKTFVD
jgi:hypothetical protein